MLAVIDPLVGIIAVAIIGPVGAYLLAARKMSGKIATSEAADLWAESKAIRDWSMERIGACDKEISELRASLREVLARLHVVEEKNKVLEAENERLKRELRNWEKRRFEREP
jgi:FtsZ-binding cell division protein ZapB